MSWDEDLEKQEKAKQEAFEDFMKKMVRRDPWISPPPKPSKKPQVLPAVVFPQPAEPDPLNQVTINISMTIERNTPEYSSLQEAFCQMYRNLPLLKDSIKITIGYDFVSFNGNILNTNSICDIKLTGTENELFRKKIIAVAEHYFRFSLTNVSLASSANGIVINAKAKLPLTPVQIIQTRLDKNGDDQQG